MIHWISPGKSQWTWTLLWHQKCGCCHLRVDTLQLTWEGTDINVSYQDTIRNVKCIQGSVFSNRKARNQRSQDNWNNPKGCKLSCWPAQSGLWKHYSIYLHLQYSPKQSKASLSPLNPMAVGVTLLRTSLYPHPLPQLKAGTTWHSRSSQGTTKKPLQSQQHAL